MNFQMIRESKILWEKIQALNKNFLQIIGVLLQKIDKNVTKKKLRYTYVTRHEKRGLTRKTRILQGERYGPLISYFIGINNAQKFFLIFFLDRATPTLSIETKNRFAIFSALARLRQDSSPGLLIAPKFQTQLINLTHYYLSEIEARQHQTNYWITVQMKNKIYPCFCIL